LPSPGTKAEEKDEWIVVLGGSGTVGQFAVQVRCSPKKACIVWLFLKPPL
jgi:NADPH:quinone reductase-like Zn-dependent oxidoreductase